MEVGSDSLKYITSRSAGNDTVHSITRDVAFNRLSFDDGDPKNPTDNGEVQVGNDGLQVRLVQPIDEDQFRKTTSRAINATRGVDLDNPPDEADWEEMLRGGLQTSLEDFVVVFEVSGASRACTHQLVRSRRAAFHQQSMRAHYYGSQPEFRMPESVWLKPKARKAFMLALEATHLAYQAACEEDVSYQDARYILPEGTTNYILLEYPLREFINVYAYRACSMFQWEIVMVMRKCREVLVEAHPWLAPYIKITCEKTHGSLDWDGAPLEQFGDSAHAHTCNFQGWEEVEGQCDFPWARETNRAFKSERHTIKRREAPEEAAKRHAGLGGAKLPG